MDSKEMYARLWWKDLRQFWSIWIFLLLTSFAAQLLVLCYADSDARMVLVPLALSFAWLYAVAVGAAAFAGERENGTLRLLDNLAVDRFLLWRGKASFALVTTLALAFQVGIPAVALSPIRWAEKMGGYSPWVLVGYLVLLMEALGWGLLVSALSRTALTAALGAACCGAASFGASTFDLNDTGNTFTTLIRSIPWRLLVTSATFAISAVVLIREGQGIVIWTKRRSRSRNQQAIEQAWTASKPPIVFSSPIIQNAAIAARPRKIWARWPEIRSILWLTCHQGWRLWSLLMGVILGGLALLFAIRVQNNYGLSSDLFFFILTVGALAIAAGINVFGAENRGRTHRFLANHGARPGLVWGMKILPWAISVAVFWILTLLPMVEQFWRSNLGGVSAPWQVLALVGLWFYPFPIAILCGMVMRRGITAWVVSLIGVMAVLIPMIALLGATLISPFAALVPPVAVLFLTWAWRRDWMLNLPAPGRWIRLSAWSVGTLAVLFAWHVTNRAWGIPNSPALAPPAAWTAPLPPDDRNAAILYETIQRKGLRNVGSERVAIASEWGKPSPERMEFLETNAEIYGLVRKAAALPDCRTSIDPAARTAFTLNHYQPIDLYAQLVAIHASDLGRKGDLAGAWGDIEAIFRMAQQQTQDATAWQTSRGLEIEEGALGLAMQWAAESKQTPALLRAALDAYRKLPPMTPMSEIVRGEAAIMEQTFALPREDIRRDLAERASNGRSQITAWEAIWVDASTMPWEIERARRINRHRFNEAIEQAAPNASGHRIGETWFDLGQNPSKREALLLSVLSPHVWFYEMQNDVNEVGRRALLQILALRIWQLEHNGKLPESLDALVPDLLPSLPADPYNPKHEPFKYIVSDGKPLLSLASAITNFRRGGTTHENQIDNTQGYRLLYSIGVNYHDNGGSFRPNLPGSSENDIIFPLKDDVGKNSP